MCSQIIHRRHDPASDSFTQRVPYCPVIIAHFSSKNKTPTLLECVEETHTEET